MSWPIRFAFIYGPGWTLRTWKWAFALALFMFAYNLFFCWTNWPSLWTLFFNGTCVLWWGRGVQVAWNRRELRI